MLARIEPCDLYGKELEAVDFVVEAATEDVVVKREVFATLDRACRGGVVLATNTSSISITTIGAAVTRPERVIGMHFMNPPPLMKLVEIIRGLATGDGTYEMTRALAERLGKQTVLSRDIPGFIVNRVLMPMLNEACFALYEGIGSVEDMDIAIQLGLNHPMGPFALMDLIGLDTTLSILEVLHRNLGDPKYRPVRSCASTSPRGGWDARPAAAFTTTRRRPVPSAGAPRGADELSPPRTGARRARWRAGHRHRQPSGGAQRARRRDAGRAGRGLHRARGRTRFAARS